MSRLGTLLVGCVLFVSLPLWSQCSAPSLPGIRICSPTPNSIGAEPGFAVILNSTPSAGASMSKWSDVTVVHVTDGAPRDPNFIAKHFRGSTEEYGKARALEVRMAEEYTTLSGRVHAVFTEDRR